MKKIVILMISLLPPMLASLPIYAYDFEVDGIYYNIGDNNTVTVTKGEVKYVGTVSIPERAKNGNTTYSVLSIGNEAFQNCSELTSITIPNSVLNIGELSFAHCKSLVSVTIPDNITNIGNYAFMYCTGLSSVTIGGSVTSIGIDAFWGCNNLSKITSNIKQPFIVSDKVFGSWEKDIYSIAILTVPKGTKSLYQSTAGWNQFQNIVEASDIGQVFESDGINYRIGDNNTVSVTRSRGCSGDIVIPSRGTYNGVVYTVISIEDSAFDKGHVDYSITSVAIPGSVKRIESEAFGDLYGLTAVYIMDLEAWCNISFSGSESNPLHHAHHLFLNGIEIKDLRIPNGVTFISNRTFWCCTSLTSVTIPNCVTGIGADAFWHCSGLTSLTIPNSVTFIGSSAFYGCKSLTTIVSEIENPFEISDNVFDSDIYATATLTVPAGTKYLYQSTAGWNKFQNIVEAEADQSVFEENGITYLGTVNTQMAVVQSVSSGVKNVIIPESVYYNGKTYQVTAVDDQAFTSLDVNYISLPTTVTSITDKTFSRCNMGALVWSAEATLPGNTLSNASMGTDANFLLYVKSASYAPSTVKNVVVNGVASSVLLSDDGGKFYCPEQFKANSISYTHYYNMETGGGKGWETLALPFDVQKISHSTRGEIIPFAAYKNELSQKPFWLANFTVSGFKRTSAIQANEPYIIAMPNSSNYNNNYNLAGSVTFSSENIVVPKTPSFSGTFLPAFDTVSKSSSVMALNVNNRNVTYTGNFDAGSRFISNLRDVRPFEAYMVSTTRGVYVISVDDGTTGLEDILISADEASEVTIHTLSGQLVERTIRRDFDKIWNSLSKGVYIVNGKKLIK